MVRCFLRGLFSGPDSASLVSMAAFSAVKCSPVMGIDIDTRIFKLDSLQWRI